MTATYKLNPISSRGWPRTWCARLAKGFPPVATPFEKVGSVSSQNDTTHAAFCVAFLFARYERKGTKGKIRPTLLSAEQRQVKERNGINGGDPPQGGEQAVYAGSDLDLPLLCAPRSHR